jgi:hypothetical protein
MNTTLLVAMVVFLSGLNTGVDAVLTRLFFSGRLLN